jgi:hypothetical protein
MACTAVADDEAGAAEAAFTATPTLQGWPLIPEEASTEAWLVDGEVSIRYKRAVRRGLDEQGRSRPECEAVVASDVQLLVYAAPVSTLPKVTASFELSVEDTVSTAFGQGTHDNTTFERLEFVDGFRPGTGEAAKIASVRDFPIAARCSGSGIQIRQTATLKRTFTDGSTATATGSTSLASVLTMGDRLIPNAPCERETQRIGDGVIVERCVGQPRDPRETGVSVALLAGCSTSDGGIIRFGSLSTVSGTPIQ